DVIDWEWQTVNGVRTLVDYHNPGVARGWLIDPNPVAVNNNDNLNAAQLRGNFQFNVQGPDYDYLARLEHDTFSSSAVTLSAYFNSPFWTWGTPYDFMRMAFGQSNIVLNGANPELTVTINSDNKKYDYYTGNGNLPYSTVYTSVVGPYALTKVNI